MDEFFKKKPSRELEENLRRDMKIEPNEPVDVNSPMYRYLIGQSDENQRRVDQIKKDIEMAAENTALDPETTERLRLEREGDPTQRERFKNLRRMILEKKYPGYKE